MRYKELVDKLVELQMENSRLKSEVEVLRNALYSIHAQARTVLGIEAAAQAREDLRRKQDGS